VDLHVPEGPVRSVKDFLLHILIVTIGILIAIGLEQLVEARHRAHLAHDAVEGFSRELTSDRGDLSETLSAIPKMREKITAEIANLSTPGPHRIDYPGVHFNVMSTSSWDTAMATQALAELTYDQAHRYAEAYDSLRVVAEVEREGLALWEDLRSFGDDAGGLAPEQRRALIERLRRYETFAVVLESAGQNALTKCNEALGEKPHA